MVLKHLLDLLDLLFLSNFTLVDMVRTEPSAGRAYMLQLSTARTNNTIPVAGPE